MKSSFAILALLAAAAPRGAASQAVSKAKVDRLVEDLRSQRSIPGLSIAIVKNGVVVHARGFGMANVEHRVPATDSTVYQSGSVGKQFTATAVMMLAEDGKLSIDDPIRKHLTDAPTTWAPITVRHLLTHTSGLGDYPDSMDFRRDYTEAQLLQMVYAQPLQSAPGAKWSYSNLGYLTLGVLIRRVTGRFYGDVLGERIFEPLGMATRIISESDIVPHRSAGYVMGTGTIKNQEWVSPSLNTTADGALYFTVLDLARWDAALYGNRLLPQARLAEMWTPVKLNDGSTHPYGFGWAVRSVAGHRVVEHGGAWQGFLTHIVRYPDDRLTVIVLVNLAARASRPGEIAHRIAALYLPAIAESEPSR